MCLGDWSFALISNYLSSEGIVLTARLVIVTTINKSAQIPFSTWLPAVMAAVTPESAIVHSSTLLSAGVHLTIQCSSPLIDSVKPWLLLVSNLIIFVWIRS